MIKKLWVILLFLPLWSMAQEDAPKNWELSGYMKNLQTWIFINNGPQTIFLQDNLLHNRLNFSWYLNDHWKLRADLRTRVFFGDLVRTQPNYADLVENANDDYFDLSMILLDRDAWVAHSMLDRAYLEWSKDDWELRFGRQRVNWGISTIWNPNDVFNAFTFTDFDYEERPGSDALRIKRYIGFASSIEFAAKAADRLDEAVFAALWKWNRWDYDFQLLGGYVKNEWTIGAGWAGNLNNAGFKGEWTYFIPLEKELVQSFALTFGVDYVFGNGLYGNLAYLYNSNGSIEDDVSGLFSFELSAKNLYPYRHAILVQASYPITSLINTSLAFIYSPVSVHPLFANPTLSISIANNWDLDFVGQIVLNEQNASYKSPLQAVFLRLKLSY